MPIEMKLTDAPIVTGENEEEQAFLLSLAEDFVTMLEDTERAMAAKFAAQYFDTEEGSEFWKLLPSKVKTAIKRGGMKVGTTCEECKLTGTHTRHCSIGGRFA